MPRTPPDGPTAPTREAPVPAPVARRSVPLSWLVAGVLVVATALVFSLGLLGDFIWDDTLLIVRNDHVHHPSSLGAALVHPFWYTSERTTPPGAMAYYYRPAITLAYALEFAVFGPHPGGYHAVNLALHIGCVLLVFAWLRRRLASSATPDTATRAAGLGAALFAVHPTRPESVTWISGCTDIWMALWVLLALAVWHRRRDALGLAFTAAMLVLATLSKESAIVVPFALLADTLLCPPEPTTRGRDTVAAAGLCAAVVGAFALRFTLPAIRMPPSAHDPLGVTAVRVVSSLGHYVACAAWPVPPTVQAAAIRFDATGHEAYAPWSVAVGALCIGAGVAMGVLAWKRAAVRPWLADTLWFAVLLAPVLNVVPLGTNVLVSERFLYLPLLGVCALLGRAAARVMAGSQAVQRVGTVAACGVVLGASVVTLHHVPHLLSEDALWTYEYGLHSDEFGVVAKLAELRWHEHRYAEYSAILRRGITDVARGGSNRTYAILLTMMYAAAEVDQAHDADTARLVELRTFFDAVAGPPGTVAAINDPHGRVQLTLTASEHASVVDHLVDPYRLYRALTHLRTLSFETAEPLLRSLTHDAPQLARGWRGLIVMYAGEGQWDSALAAVDRARRALPGDPIFRGFAERIMAARREITPLPEGSPERAVATASLAVDLGMPALARRTLAPTLATRPLRADAVIALSHADEADGRPLAARDDLQGAQAADPSLAGVLGPALQDLIARHPGLPRTGP